MDRMDGSVIRHFAKPPGADSVNRPAHYTFSAIEVIDAIEAWALNFHRGQVVKYIARAGRKDPAKKIEDLEKAQWYIEREIARLKGVSDGVTPENQS